MEGKKAKAKTATGGPERATGCRKCSEKCGQCCYSGYYFCCCKLFCKPCKRLVLWCWERVRRVLASLGLAGRDEEKERMWWELNTDERKSPVRRITVQSLDFDWIFEETAGGRMKNIETLVTEVLYKHSSEEVFNRKAIQVFIDLMWQTF